MAKAKIGDWVRIIRGVDCRGEIMSETKHTPDWIPVKLRLPTPGVVVATKIDDSKGLRNECPLKWVTTPRGGLWFFPDASMYVYYTPTHWAEMSKAEGR
jgi:hypothetical protein